jgi:hypothetical protein
VGVGVGARGVGEKSACCAGIGICSVLPTDRVDCLPDALPRRIPRPRCVVSMGALVALGFAARAGYGSGAIVSRPLTTADRGRAAVPPPSSIIHECVYRGVVWCGKRHLPPSPTTSAIHFVPGCMLGTAHVQTHPPTTSIFLSPPPLTHTLSGTLPAPSVWSREVGDTRAWTLAVVCAPC